MSTTKTTTKAYQTRYNKSVGPRTIGGRYLSSYSQTEYTVLAIDVESSGWMHSITVQDNDGIRTHGTYWDRRDCVLS